MDNTPLFDKHGKLLDDAALDAFAETLEPQRRQLFDDLVAAARAGEADDATAEACASALHAAVRARDAAIAACPKHTHHELWLQTVKGIPMSDDRAFVEAVRTAENEVDQARVTARAAGEVVRASRATLATTLSAWTAGTGGPKSQFELSRAFAAQSQANRAYRAAHGIPQRQIGVGQGRRQGAYRGSARNPISTGPAVPQQVATRLNAERARAIAATNAAYARRKLPSEL